MNIRIQAAADLVKEGRIPADIGTDHGYLPILLTETGRCPKAYACDIAPGPLSAAVNNIRRSGLEDKVTAILSDGLDHVPADADVVCICGMGVHTACEILERDPAKLTQFREIIVQVNDDVPYLRQWIADHGYRILAEKIVRDKAHVYEIVMFTADEYGAYSEEEIFLGPLLMREASDTYLQYRTKQLQKIRDILHLRKGRNSEELIRQERILENYLNRNCGE